MTSRFSPWSFFLGVAAVVAGIAVVGIAARVMAEPGATWVSLQGIAMHEHEPKRGRYNNANWSLGLQYELTPDVRLSAGYFKDSFYKDNFGFGGGYMPLHGQVADVKLHFGVSAGVALYYKATPTPFGGLTASLERGRWGLDVLHIPTRLTVIYLKSAF